jgi:hypothetical protein
MRELRGFRPIDEQGVEILNELIRRHGVQPERVDADGTHWFDPSKFASKGPQIVPDDQFKTGRGTFKIIG